MADHLWSVSPVDGRYVEKSEKFSSLASEAALIKYRIQVEVEWLIHLSENSKIGELERFSDQVKEQLRNLYNNFTTQYAERVKEIEKITNHDVKAVEYFIRETSESFLSHGAAGFIHFACTSEDINSTAYALMMKDLVAATDKHLSSVQQLLIKRVIGWKDVPMLSRTHGQAASPTTLGKELLVFTARLMRQRDIFQSIPLLAKMNGAVGNFNAHITAYPDLNWVEFSREVIEDRLGLKMNPLTTQIEPHDYMAEIFDLLSRICTILIDFSRDVWTYISMDYFTQIAVKGEVGSSTMPHKINPIDFENAEGNLLMARNSLRFFADKLPISRMQRDLTDSTTLRNIGVAFAQMNIALSSLSKGIEKIDANIEKIQSDLNNRWELLAEPIQTVMKKFALENPYEVLKSFTRGKHFGENEIKKLIKSLDIPDSAKEELSLLSPKTYTGNAGEIVDIFLKAHKLL